MQKVLHYKTNFLNPSETFIDRLVQNHISYKPSALCYRKRSFTENIDIYHVPQTGLDLWLNVAAFHSNFSLPFYDKVLTKIQPDLIHAHFGYDAFKLIGLAKKHKKPLVVSFYGSDVSRLPLEFGWKRRYKKLASLGDHFIATSNYMKGQLSDLGFPKTKISIVRFGLNLKECLYQENSLNPQKIMMVGRMVGKKGFEYAIEAIAKLSKMGKQTEFNIYGYGPLMNTLVKRTVNLGATNYIHFHGYQPFKKIMDAHDQHTIMLVPSVTAKDGDMEGLPNTILEAMAKGTIVIASRHAAIPEVIQHTETGFLVDEKDANGLAKILERITNGEFDLNKIRRNARTLIEQEYSVPRMVQEVEHIYDKVTA